MVNFPNQTCPTSVRRNHEGISLVARFGLEIGDLAKCETIDIYVVENDETVAHRRTVRAAMKAGSVGEALRAVASIARGRPCWKSSVIVL
jgi:hypothetical protein